MIFVTLGSQKFQFNRLLEAIDSLIEKGVVTDEVFAQIGYSDYIPKKFLFKRFLDREEFLKMEEMANIIITHGGTGAIIGAIKMKKKVIAVPRRAIYGEHVDDHQLQLVNQFRELDLICECDDCEMLNEALIFVKKTKFKFYKSNTKKYIQGLEEFIDSI